eukprot:4665619-Ditylum_brightwellii.AAC.1
MSPAHGQKKSSHKLGEDTKVAYEIGLQLNSSKNAWRRGPIPAEESNDVTIFRTGLKQKIPIGRRIIAGSGYKGEEDIISTDNDLDPRDIDYFKDHILSRHESFNLHPKQFKILEHQFCHGVENHRIACNA